MTYDQTQLQKDLRNIVSMFGKRRQRGFFTEGVYEDVYIKLVDRYTTPVQIFIKDTLVEAETLLAESFTGQHILKLVVKIEDRAPGACDYFKR